jgi:hypothetical protein
MVWMICSVTLANHWQKDRLILLSSILRLQVCSCNRKNINVLKGVGTMADTLCPASQPLAEGQAHPALHYTAAPSLYLQQKEHQCVEGSYNWKCMVWLIHSVTLANHWQDRLTLLSSILLLPVCSCNRKNINVLKGVGTGSALSG